MRTNRVAAWAASVCFVFGLWGAAHSQIGPAPGGGGGTPCTTTALSLQINSSGSFGCATEWLYTSAKKSLGDGSNFQMYWNSGNANFSFRNAADGAFVPIQASAVYGGTAQLTASTTGYTAANGILLADPTNRTSMQDLEFSSTAGASFSTTTNPDSGSYDLGFSRNAAGVLEVNSSTAGTYREVKLRSVIIGGTVPGISGCTAGTQTGGATAGTFASGTTGACTVVLTFAFTAPTGWSCAANNQTTANLIRQSAASTTTATIVGTTVSGDVVNFHCMAH